MSKKIAAGVAGAAIAVTTAGLLGFHHTDRSTSSADTAHDGHSSPTGGETPAPVASPSRGPSVAQQIAAVRAEAAKHHIPIAHALVRRPDAPTGPVRETNRGSLATGGTLRTVTAGYDLTGQRELLWAADPGKPAGPGRCTQNFHFSDNTAPRIRPTMLMCWRTSARRSAIVVAVAGSGRPDQTKTVASLKQAWDALG